MKRKQQPAIILWIRKHWDAWLARRLPAAEQITLSHKGIFILPTRFGLAWILLLSLLFIFGTNYQNNLIIGLSFLLFSIFNTSIIYCYQNLAGITVSSTPPPPAYAGDTVFFPIYLSSHKPAFQIRLNFRDHQVKVKEQVTHQPQHTLVPFINKRRGQIKPGRIKIESHYPLGLCRAWSYADVNIEHLIFAHPKINERPLTMLTYSGSNKEAVNGKYVPGVDEFKGLKQYAVGESLRHVAWKQWAQGRGMLSKEFHQPQGEPLWLSLDPNTQGNIEQKLSELSWQINNLSDNNQIFGLKVGQQSISPSQGEQHRLATQKAIALFSPRKPD